MMNHGTEMHDGIRRLSDAQLEPPPIPRVKTGFADEHWGADESDPGIPRMGLTLLCGEAGAGTSTFCLQLLARVAKATGQPGLYVESQEENDSLHRRAVRLGVNQEDVLVLGVLDIRRGAAITEKTLERWQPSIVVIDSLMASDSKSDTQSFLRGIKPLSANTPIVVVQPILDENNCPNSYDVDTLLMSPSNEAFRILTTIRSRFGQAHESYFTMTKQGLESFLIPPEDAS